METLTAQIVGRKYAAGSEPVSGGKGASFRVWAPLRQKVEVVTSKGVFSMQRESDGYFSGSFKEVTPGTRYRYRLDGTDEFPDPASRYQPEGPHGPSVVVDASAFRWTDGGWKGRSITGQILYELHIGTFTPEGTWGAAADQLPALAKTGITVVELMPVAEFSGEFGWGYDGVNWYAPSHLYGSPDDMRRFVDRAHSLGIAVILDVVYNHLGPDGNYTSQFSSDYVTSKYSTDWGEAINYDGPNSGPVRDFVSGNAAYWIDEFHLDGLRLDATQNIYDDSDNHIIAEIGRAVRKAAGGRDTIIVAENEPQHTNLVRPPEQGGYGLDGLWNDDYHHSAVVALTGRSEAYYTDYRGTPQEFVSAMKYGYLYQGQFYKWQQQRRGTPAFGLPKSAFVTFLENHDQVANSALGKRMHQLASPALHRAMKALTILGPGTPMLFQGEEFDASAPFLFFADLPEWLVEPVRKGRREFMAQWRSIASSTMSSRLADPASRKTFEACKLNLSEREKNAAAFRFSCDLISLKRKDPVLSAVPACPMDGAVLSDRAFVLRYFCPTGDDRLLVLNLGIDLHLDPSPEPLLAPPEGCEWESVLCTEDPEYGGSGAPKYDDGSLNWTLPGHAAALLRPVVRKEPVVNNAVKKEEENKH
jgi:maltooligosyltrehalose trehalohydrolase